MRHHAEVTGHILGPPRLQSLILPTANINTIHSAGHHIKTGGKNHGVELDFGVTDHNPVTCEATNWVLIEIDQFHIGLIERLQVIGLGR